MTLYDLPVILHAYARQYPIADRVLVNELPVLSQILQILIRMF